MSTTPGSRRYSGTPGTREATTPTTTSTSGAERPARRAPPATMATAITSERISTACLTPFIIAGRAGMIPGQGVSRWYPRRGTRGTAGCCPFHMRDGNVCVHGDHRASYGHKEVLMSESTASTTATAARPGAHRAYIVLLRAFLLDGVLQITLAGFGVFDLDGRKLGAKGNDAFAAHAVNGMLMSVLALAIIVLAAVAKEGN